MGDSFTSSSYNAPTAANTHAHALPQPTLSLVNEDNDEPPSSGSNRSGQTQVNDQNRSGGGSASCSPVAVAERDGVYNDVNKTRHVDAGPNKFDVVHIELGERQETLVENNLPAVGKKNDTAIFGVRSMFNAGKLRTLFKPTKPLGPSPTYTQSLIAALKYTPLNVLLVFIPISWAMHFTHQNTTLIFVLSALGLIPLAALLGFGTEQIALKTSASVGGLLNATLGNIVEMIIAGIALKECELELVQSSLLGGLLSNLLLVLGMAFIVGGYRFQQQEFQPMVAQLNSSLMIVSVISLIVPVAFHEFLEDRLDAGRELPIMLELSRGASIILIFIYFAYLFFQFYSHNHLFLEVDTNSSISSRSSGRSAASSTVLRSSDSMSMASINTSSSSDPDSDDDFHKVRLNTVSALALVVASTGLAYLTAEDLVDSLHGLLEAHPSVSKEWITLIIIPVISNAAEHVTAVIVASKGKFDLAMSVAIGSCIQMALFVIPVLILVAWGMGKPLTLLFDPLETLVLFFSVLLVKFSVEDGKSHWMSGMALVSVYVLIVLSFWHFPETHRMLQGAPITCS
ncbi:Vacuolar calcium ion transporter [Leucoagaricus sp. SymC.cos]|nr:Vacuolar calcium ion transporter [Leucoagaricus sp. SymC.cos]